MKDLRKNQAASAAITGARAGVQNQKEIDVMRLLSRGVKGGKTFFTEEINAPSTTITITNDESTMMNVLFIPHLAADLLVEVYGGVEALLLKFGATHLATALETAGLADPLETQKIICNDQGRTLSELIGYCNLNPLRFLSMSMESRSVETGFPDSSNFSTSFKTIWWSPFHQAKEEFLPLRKFQNSGINSPQYLDVNFKKEGFPVLLSEQNFFVLSCRPGSELVTTFVTGYANDSAQYLYRAVVEGDAVVPSFSGVGK